MNNHVFILVWGEQFVRDYVEVALPLQCMVGNLPSLTEYGEIYYHIYTNRSSLGFFDPEIQELKKFVNLEFHLIDGIEVGGRKLSERVKNLIGPQVRYDLQFHCFQHLARLALDDRNSLITFLDPNTLISDGTLSAASMRIRDGSNVVNVNFLRVDSERFFPLIKKNLISEPRSLVRLAISHFHHLQKAFFLDADPFTAYPSQLNWWIDSEGCLARAFIPSPLMFKVTPEILKILSTTDYDLALRCWPDEEIYLCTDSDEMLVIKHSGSSHYANRVSEVAPSTRDLAIFLITSTHIRHRIFGDVPIFYHMNDINSKWERPLQESNTLLVAVYKEIERIAMHANKLDAKFLMYLKSHTGPIENYMSPALEPAALSII